MAGRMTNKVVIVTGAAQGIGRGCAEMLAQEGARVVIGDVLIETGNAVAEAIEEAGGVAIFQQTDVTKEEQCAALFDRAVHAFGQLDALVNNVGWFPRATLEETTTELWERVMQLNLRSAFYCCKHAMPHLKRAGGGSIVNIGSDNGIQGQPNLVAYAAAKGGLLTLTRTLAAAYAADHIRVNYVIPGWVLTEGEIALHQSRGISEDELRHAGDILPLGRHQTTTDVAYAVTYLASDESTQVTGQLIALDAGMSMLPRMPKPPSLG